MNYIQLVRRQWSIALNDKRFVAVFFANFLLCLVLYFSIAHWLLDNSNRAGAVIDDPIQAFFKPIDLSYVIGLFTYTSTGLFLAYIVQFPLLLHRVFRSFAAVFVVRAICIFLLPLAPPAGTIPLYDPITDYAVNEGKILNDLFFSGHVSDLIIFALAVTHTNLRRWLFFAAFAVGSMLVIQRVHYSIDVFCAGFFAYGCHRVFVGRTERYSVHQPESVLQELPFEN